VEVVFLFWVVEEELQVLAELGFFLLVVSEFLSEAELVFEEALEF
jgi:hypothetical protein